MAVVEQLPKLTDEESAVPVVSGSGYRMLLRNDLVTAACTICQNVFDGSGIDVSPVDNICLHCANAIAVIMGNPDLNLEPVARSYGDLFPDDGTKPLNVDATGTEVPVVSIEEAIAAGIPLAKDSPELREIAKVEEPTTKAEQKEKGQSAVLGAKKR